MTEPKRVRGWPDLLGMQARDNFAVRVAPRHLEDMRQNLPPDVRTMTRCGDLMKVVRVDGAYGLPAAVVVDDDPLMAEIAERVLVAVGFEVAVVLVEKGHDERQVRAFVRAACRPRVPQVALVDWSYHPGQDGLARAIAGELVEVGRGHGTEGVRVILNSATPPDDIPPEFCAATSAKTPAGMRSAALAEVAELFLLVPFHYWQAAAISWNRADRPGSRVAVPAIAGGAA